jgi:hypothetical protein
MKVNPTLVQMALRTSIEAANYAVDAATLVA